MTDQAFEQLRNRPTAEEVREADNSIKPGAQAPGKRDKAELSVREAAESAQRFGG